MNDFLWNTEMIRFMCDAAQYGDYYMTLGKILKPYLNPMDRVCDAGCGLGYLSMAIAADVAQVVAVDRDESALSVLQKNCEAYKIDNIAVQCANMEKADFPSMFDTMIFCMYGQLQDILNISGKWCKKKVLVLKRDEPYHRFSSTKIKKDGNIDNLLLEIRRAGLVSEEKRITLNFDQPFCSLQAARDFLQLYRNDEGSSEENERYLQEKLTKIEHKDYACVLPCTRNMKLLVLEAQKVRQYLQKGERYASDF